MRDRRAVSTALGYVLNLGIATLIVTSLLFAGGSYVDSEREQTIRTELGVVGQQLAGDIETVDRLGRSTDGNGNQTVLRRTLPSRVVDVSYSVTVDDGGGDPYLELSTTNPDVTVRVELATTTPVAVGTARGGSIRVLYDSKGTEVPDDDEVVITDD